MNAINPQSRLLTLALTVTTATLSLAGPALAARYAVAVECFDSGNCFGIVIDQETGEVVDATEPQKNKRRAYRKARKRLEEAESSSYHVSDEWIECHLNPRACEN